MTTDKIKRMIDACYLAKRIRELLPELPKGVAPSYIQYLDTIHKLQNQRISVKISDISNMLNIPKPGVTRTIKEMEAKGYVSKVASKEDGRITYIVITKKGESLFQKYDKKYYAELSQYLNDISEEDADCMIRTIEAFYKVMRERRIHLE